MLSGARSFAGALVLLCACLAPSTTARQTSPLVLEATIPLPDTRGRIDHMTVDLRRGRLFVAELGNGTVDVIDLSSREVVHRIRSLRKPQGIGYSPTADMVAVANAGDGSVRLFWGEDLAPAGVVELGSDADNVRVDEAGPFVVGFGDGGLAVIDPGARSVLRQAKLPGHPEGFQLDPTGRAIVNVPDARQIALVDLTGSRQTGTWSVSGFHANFPMALLRDPPLVAVVFRNPPRLALLDASSGTMKESTETCGDADDVFFDARRHRIYVSCGTGSIAVLQDGYGRYQTISLVPTPSGARTSLFVPELDRLFVAARAGVSGIGARAAILVFRAS